MFQPPMNEVNVALLNVLGFDTANITMLVNQKIIPCSVNDFNKIQLNDDGMVMYRTLTWNEGQPSQFLQGREIVTIEGWHGDSPVLKTEVNPHGIYREDVHTKTGQLITSTVFDSEGNSCLAVRFTYNKDGVVIKQEEFSPRLKQKDDGGYIVEQGEGSVDTIFTLNDRGLPVKQDQGFEETLTTFEYDTHDRVTAIVRPGNRTEVVYDEYGQEETVTTYEQAGNEDVVTEVALDNSYRDGKLMSISIDKHIIFSAGSFWKDRA